MNCVVLGEVHASDLPYPHRLYTSPPHPRREHSSAGKLRHWLMDPRPSCRNTIVGACTGDGPCHAYSSRAPSIETKSFIVCMRSSATNPESQIPNPESRIPSKPLKA